MSKFELNYEHGEYGKRIKLEVELDQRPNKEDYQTLLDVVDKLSELQKKYLPVTTKEDMKDKQ